jgi:hypothetical protein
VLTRRGTITVDDGIQQGDLARSTASVAQNPGITGVKALNLRGVPRACTSGRAV